MKTKVEPYKLEPNRWYSVNELSTLRMLPTNNNRTYIKELILKDLAGANILKAESYLRAGIKNYRIKGEHFSTYISLKGYNL